MEQMIFEQVVAPVMRFLTSTITKHLGYATCSTKHVNNMRSKLKVLEDTSADVQNHMDTNKINNKEVPTGVPDWLNDVENLMKDVESFSSEGIGCLNMKMRYRAGRNAFKATETIEELLTKRSGFTWTDAAIPTGRVDPQPASSTTCTPSSSSSGGDGFKSRDKPFNDALKFLQQDDSKSTQVIALCGMGGVGKTTMMEQLKTVANDQKMFDWIVKVVLGRNSNMLSIQNDIALQLGGEGLREETITARADSLCGKFKEMLKEGKTRVLVILDDVWEKVELKSIGLTSPLPNGVKLLLTSRDSNICKQIATELGSFLQEVRVNVLEEAEAQNFFAQLTGVSKQVDHDKYQIGCGIVKKCGLLPLAIKLIAATLKYQEDYVWRDTHRHLMNNEFADDVQEIIRISYEYIIRKDKECAEIFLHCGLFPEDYDIQIEDLTRHAWGLKLFKNVSTLREARDRTYTCVRNLINANLLIESDRYRCVKMHDLVLAFVLGIVSKGDHAWVVNHGDVSKWGTDETSESCKRISLTCMGMYEFPRAFMYPNLSMLQLMHADTLLKFPEDFYKNLENLNVIAYYGLSYPLLPRSLENLTTLCLSRCKLTYIWSSVGDLVNLEVLSFAGCGISKLPSTIGNLRKLKVLDLTGCVHLEIDDGVFINLENLEELYMRVYNQGFIKFTQTNLEELKMLSSRLSVLEIEFVKDLAQLKDMCFKKLDKFRISMGCQLEYNGMNTLKLVTDSCSFLGDCKISELFKKTEKLQLEVKDMISLEDIGPVYSYGQRSLCSLTYFWVYNCDNLKCLFPVHVARGLGKLERCVISSCSVLEAVVHREIGSCDDDEVIKFEKLKYLSLIDLPKLESVFPVENVVELPQLVVLDVNGLPNFTSIYPDKNHTCALFNSQVRIPELKELYITFMENLKQIWSSSGEEKVNNISTLTLERLTVSLCGSIEVIFNIDMECVGDEIEQVSSSGGLRSIKVSDSWNDVEGVTTKNNQQPPLLPNLQNLHLSNMSSMSHVWKCNNWGKFLLLQNQSSFHNLTKIKLYSCNKLKCLFSPLMAKLLSNLQKIDIVKCDGMEEVVSNRDDDDDDGNEEMTTYTTTVLFPRLYSLNLHQLENLQRIGGGGDQFKFASWSLCQFSEIISISECNGLSSVIPSYAAGQMQKLKVLIIIKCKSLREVFQTQGINDNNNGGSSTNIDEGDGSMDSTYTTKIISKLEKLNVSRLSNLKTLEIAHCDLLQHIFTFCTLESLMKLEKLKVYECKAMEVIVKEENKKQKMTSKFVTFPRLKSLELFRLPNLKGFFLGMNDFQWPLLVNVMISECPQMTVFTTRQSRAPELKYIHTRIGKHSLECGLNFHVKTDLQQSLESTGLERLPWSFHNLIEINMEGNCDSEVKKIIPSIELLQLQKLERIRLYNCHYVEEVFEVEAAEGIYGESKTHVVEIPNLTHVELEHLTGLQHIWRSNHHGRTTVVKFPNLTTLSITYCYALKHVFTSSMAGSLQQLQHLSIRYCTNMELVVKVEVSEIECESTMREIVTLPCLKSLKVESLESLKGFCLGKVDFSCPSLHTLEIKYCPAITVFTGGHSATPALNIIDTSFGKCYIKEDLNSFIKTKKDEGFKF